MASNVFDTTYLDQEIGECLETWKECQVCGKQAGTVLHISHYDSQEFQFFLNENR